MKYFDHRLIWLLFRTHIFQNIYFLKAPPVAAPLKRQCYDNIWKFEQNKVKNLLSFFQFLKLLKKVIGKKLQPPWKYHPPPLSPKILIFTTPSVWQFSKITQHPLSLGGVDTMVSLHMHWCILSGVFFQIESTVLRHI